MKSRHLVLLGVLAIGSTLARPAAAQDARESLVQPATDPTIRHRECLLSRVDERLELANAYYDAATPTVRRSREVQ